MEKFEKINLAAAKHFANKLIEEEISSETVSVGNNDDGFYIEFNSEEPLSEKKLKSLELLYKKSISKLQKPEDENEVFLAKVKFISLRGISGSTIATNRLFGFVEETEAEFETKLAELKDREERDHRRIGKEMELFFFDQEAVRGLPFWLPNGLTLKKTISNFINSQEKKYGFTHIQTPILGSIDLYKTSGHYYHYKDGMFPEMEVEENELVMVRPMSCPHHCVTYKHKPRSYRDLPIRYAEEVLQYRYEHSGALIGLERVRGMELTDSHMFLTPEQLESEIENGFNIIESTLNKFEIEIDYIELACHDPENQDKYHGSADLWAKSEKILEDFLVKKGVEFKKMSGEAAFYGPKIDFQAKTALGHNITVSTLQLDYLLPEKFDLTYVDSNNEKQRPIMIHRGLIGTYERFISVLLEQTKGNLPMWLAPRQAVVIPVNNEAHGEYAQEVFEKMIDLGIRVELDNSDDRLGQKIRKYQTEKVKTQIVIGDEEVQNRNISIREFGSEETNTSSIDEIESIYKKD